MRVMGFAVPFHEANWADKKKFLKRGLPDICGVLTTGTRTKDPLEALVTSVELKAVECLLLLLQLAIMAINGHTPHNVLDTHTLPVGLGDH